MKESMTLKDVYAISERESSGSGQQNAGPNAGKDRWTRIGIGFVNRDNSINVILDAMPLNGRFHIRDRQNKTKTTQPNR